MARERIALDVDYIIRKHFLEHWPVSKLAKHFGVTDKVVKLRITNTGRTPLSFRAIHSVDHAAICAAYVGGESSKAIADRLGIQRSTINRILTRRWVPIRGRSEAELVKWSQIPKEARSAQVRAAQEARRGQVEGYTTRRRRAIGKYIKPKIWPNEQVLADMLTGRGIRVVHQFPVSVYNADLTSGPVAMEVVGSTDVRAYATRNAKRTREFFDRGYCVVFIFADRANRIGHGCADYLVPYIESARRDGPGRREYRMIRGDGQFISSGGPEFDDGAFIEAFIHAFNVARRVDNRAPD